MMNKTPEPENTTVPSGRYIDEELQDTFERAMELVKTVIMPADSGMQDVYVLGEGGRKIKLKQLNAPIVIHSKRGIKRVVGDERVVVGKSQRAQSDLFLRSLEAITRELVQFNSDYVEKLLRSSDQKLLVGLARAALEETPIDRVERMGLKGAERFQQLLERAGGSAATSWVAELLNTSEEAVRKRVQRNGLIARRTPTGELSFPRFQFDEAKGRLLPGLQGLMSRTKGWEPEELIRFLLVRHDPEHTDETPLQLLRAGKIDRVLSLAETHLDQRA